MTDAGGPPPRHPAVDPHSHEGTFYEAKEFLDAPID